MRERTIRIESHPVDLAKPALGAPCNGCGICCLAEPCPLGMVLSLKRAGRCVALQWDSATARYRCGALALSGHGGRNGSIWLRLWRRLVLRWIGAGVGCDCSLQVVVASSSDIDALRQE